ncbi:hypothetical protein BX666DRAFT_1544741 [Dichotomocladium elegans]|nr:hypothetical protein BX666DRAFT_1544741 [Dichotomocladium elegans]
MPSSTKKTFQDNNYMMLSTMNSHQPTCWLSEPKPRVSCSSPLSVSAHCGKKTNFVEEFKSARDQLSHFRNKMHGLAEQMDDIEADIIAGIRQSIEIEQDIVQAQESNVNLQIRLENAVVRQKETDTDASRTIRNLHTNLAMIAYATTELQDRLAILANCQKTQTGSASAAVDKMREYVKMLEEAQDAMQLLHQRRSLSPSPPLLRPPLPPRPSSLKQETLSPAAASATVNATHTIPNEMSDLYRHRIIRKRTSLHGISSSNKLLSSPGEGLRILLN